MSNAVRKATLDDCEEVGRVHYLAHVETYAGSFPPGAIEGFTVEQRVQMWRRMVGTGSDELWVAEVAAQIVGFASTGRPREDAPVRELELGTIYLLAAHHGSGLGQALFDAACGTRPVSLWVLDDNPRAHAFYARNGFAPDGASKADEHFGDVREIRMVR